MQNVHHLAHNGRVRLAVDVRQHRHADFGADFAQDFQTAFKADAAKRFAGGAVGLIEAGLENIENAERGTGFFERGGGLEAELFVFNHARPGDEKQPAR